MDRLDTDCLVSLAKRKERVYGKSSKSTSRYKTSSTNASIQELGESVSISEADSGFETLCSTNGAEITDTSGLDRNVSTATENKLPPLRRSPRNVSKYCSNSSKPSSYSDEHLSSSFGAIAKSSNHILTRSRSLRLSGESYFSESPLTPKGESSGRYIPAQHDIDNASASLISRFDTSLMEDDNKAGINEQHTAKGTKVSCFSFFHNEPESQQNSNDCKIRTRLSIASHSTVSENKSKEGLSPASNLSSRMVHRDIPYGHGHRKYRKQNYENKTKCEKITSFGRIVYSPGIFHGRERMDMVRRLHDMTATHILDKIWSSLSAEELGRSLQVSKSEY